MRPSARGLRSSAAGTFALLLISSIWLIVPAQAGSISGVFDGTATLTPTNTPGVFIQNFMGDGTDTTYGAFDVTSTSTVDFSSPPTITITNGMLQEVFAAGTLFGTGSGSGRANGNGTARFTADFIVTGGTGIFGRVHGTATIMGTITQTGPLTEAISNAAYTGTLTSVPEPSSISLLVLGASLGYRFLRGRLTSATCRKRHVRRAGGNSCAQSALGHLVAGLYAHGREPNFFG